MTRYLWLDGCYHECWGRHRELGRQLPRECLGPGLKRVSITSSALGSLVFEFAATWSLLLTLKRWNLSNIRGHDQPFLKSWRL